MVRVGTLGDYIDAEKNGLIDFTDDGKCSGCGNCCSNLLPLTNSEVAVIRRYIKTHGIKAELRRPPMAGPVLDMMCPFRDENAKKCKIYGVRPLICREFVCNKSPRGADPALFRDEHRLVMMRETFFGE